MNTLFDILSINGVEKGRLMMKNKKHHIGIRHDDEELHYKLHFIAKYEGRTANGHILYLIRKNIAEYKAKNGEIKMPPENK